MDRAKILCVGDRCSRDTARARLTESGVQLCRPCIDALAEQCTALPELYAECELLLAGSERNGSRTSGGPLPGMPFNASAAEVRLQIMSTLGSWSGLIAQQRGVAVPDRSAPALGAFLRRHIGWLAGHDAAADLSAETAQLTRWARRVAYPSELRRIPVGRCVETACAGSLTAVVRPQSSSHPVEISCDGDITHSWPGHEWLQLARRIEAAHPRATRPSTRWLSAADIARLFQVAAGSVYRLASEQRWRRESRRGRTYYHGEDVTEAFRRRDGALH